MKRQSLIILLCTLSVFLCAELTVDRDFFFYSIGVGRDGQQKRIAQAVRDFNDYYMIVHSGQGSREMVDLIPASTEMRHRIFKDVGFLDFSGRKLVYDLFDLKVDSLELTSPFRAEADLTEQWNYVYQDNVTRLPVSEIKAADGRFRYFLAKMNGRWKVYDYRPLRGDPDG